MIKCVKRKKIIIGILLAAVIFILIAAVSAISFINRRQNQKESVVYRETVVEYGNLTVGISEDSSVSIGTLEQLFDLDISALVSSSTESLSSESISQTGGASFPAGGMNTGQMISSGGGIMSFFDMGNSYTAQSQTLEIDKVHIAVGQEIKEGDILYTLTSESVDEIRTALQEDIDDTLAEYNSLLVEQQESRNLAKQGYDTYVTNGTYAQLIYDNELNKLKEEYEDSVCAVNDKQNELNENLLKLIEVQKNLDKAQKYLKEAENAVLENYDDRYNNAYYYTVYENTRETAQKLVDEFEEKIENLTDENETLVNDIAAAVRTMNQAQINLEKGGLELKQTYDTDTYYSDIASEWYSIQTAGLDNDARNALKNYETALEKLEKLDTYIVDGNVLSEYSGVVTDVPLSEGDTVSTSTQLLTLYNKEDVTMDISISEDDYKAIDVDGKVNIVCTAHPEKAYEGVVSEVSDAEYDSNSGGIYYTITVTVQGDVSDLYEGMTGEVTLVTKESEKVLYVSNRAIFREGVLSYVKMRDGNGDIIEKDVKTGFSDGINVEIKEGLSDGDVVLIESKVSG